MRGRGVDSQPAPLGKFLDVGCGRAEVAVDEHGLLPLLGCHATVLRVSSGHRWQALSRFLRNVPDTSVCAQGVADKASGGRAGQVAGGRGVVLSRRMTSPGTGMTRGWGWGAASAGSARTRPAAISPIRLSGSRTVVSGG